MTPARCLSARAPRESRDAAPAMVDGHHTAYHLSCIIPIFASWLDRDARENGARRLSRCPTPTPRNQRTRYGTLCSMRVTSRSRHSSHVAGVGTHRTSALGARGTGPRSTNCRSTSHGAPHDNSSDFSCYFQDVRVAVNHTTRVSRVDTTLLGHGVTRPHSTPRTPHRLSLSCRLDFLKTLVTSVTREPTQYALAPTERRCATCHPPVASERVRRSSGSGSWSGV